MTYLRALFCFVGLSVCFAVSHALGATNEWTKATSGDWEELFWSLGHLPTASDDWIGLHNSGFKALAITTNTTALQPDSLHINNLIVDAPEGSANQLLLNWAGLSVPLLVNSSLVIGTNGSLASHFSAIEAATADLQGPATFADGATARLDLFRLESGANLTVNNASLTASNAIFIYGSVTQYLGTVTLGNVFTALRHPTDSGSTAGTYDLANGVLVTGNAALGYYDLSGLTRCTFRQSGGVHSNTSMTLSGGQRHFQLITHTGFYYLSGGLLASDLIFVTAGVMEQSGGTNLAGEIFVDSGGTYTLNGGQLVTSKIIAGTVDCLRDAFIQNGGNHVVQNLVLGNGVRYSLRGGTLTAGAMDIGVSGELRLSAGVITNSGMVTLRRGSIVLEGAPQQLGTLEVLEAEGSSCPPGNGAAATLQLNPTNGAATLRFADSREVAWTGDLQILNWSLNHSGAGPDHVYVGTNSSGLTYAQLSSITFVNPGGLPAGDYAAHISSTGEIVPALPPMEFTRQPDALVLTWTNGFQLLTSTNVLGPWELISGATSPFTNTMEEPVRFFQLVSPAP